MYDARFNDRDFKERVRNAQSFVLPALVLCGMGADEALTACDDLCTANPEVAMQVSGYLVRGEEVPNELTMALKSASLERGPIPEGWEP